MTGTVITVVTGNIVGQPDCDGVVNAANASLMAGSGVCGAIHAAAGPRLEPFARRFAPLRVGDALATPGFDLPGCRLIIHTVGPKYFDDPDPPIHLARAIQSAIDLADRNQLRRLAVPALSTGIYRYPPEEAVPILVESAAIAAPTLRHLIEIRFVVTSDAMLALFREAIARQSGTG
jgi:O-acetyl-ADP-ribose deacetylase (regulator of RNase III)